MIVNALCIYRMLQRKPAPEPEPEPEPVVVTKRAPHRGVPIPPQQVKKATVVAPFSFTGRIFTPLRYIGILLKFKMLLTGFMIPSSLTPQSSVGIRICRNHMFLGLLDPDPLVRGPDPDPSIIKQKESAKF